MQWMISIKYAPFQAKTQIPFQLSPSIEMSLIETLGLQVLSQRREIGVC